MTKNITIQEGGTAKPMSNVAKIRTDLQGGGTCYWVPEDETHQVTKHITENGTYEAVDDDAYGYSKVTVNVPGGKDGPPGGSGSSISWKDPTSGNDYVSTVNDDGTKTDTKVPSSIRVVTPPTKTQYDEGETIVYDGIVVKACDAQGNEMQTVPFSELDFPEGVAPAPQSSGASSSLDTGVSQPIPCSSVGYCSGIGDSGEAGTHNYRVSGNGKITLQFDGSYLAKVAASDNPSDVYEWDVTEEGGVGGTKPLGLSYTAGGKTVYYYSERTNAPWRSVDSLSPDAGGTSWNAPQVAWTLIYGTITSGTVSIPVNWPKAPGGKTLSDSFEITVNDASS